MKLSYSKISSFERCPYAYKKTYIEKVPPQAKKYFSFGHSLHGALEEFYSSPLLYRLGLKKPTKNNLRRALLKRWIKGGSTPEENEAALRDAEIIIEKYYETFISDSFTPAWRVEAPFSFTAGRHTVMGIIDRIHRLGEHFEIIDYKTNKKIPQEENLKRDLQLYIYYLGCREFFRKNITRVSYIFLRYMKKISFDTSSFDDDGIRNRLASAGDRMAAEKDFLPRRNMFCGACDFRKECGIFESV
ncbi:PD-(D/E)XK nuclease family protein [bacterium]|nr:PD-(D/E)XK nuclease family protein [bacterium]